MKENRRFPFYGSVPYISPTEYLFSEVWQYCGTEKAYDGTYWDILENPFTGEYAYTNLEEVSDNEL